ncbi:MAG: hypothetical protein CVU98_01550 [Firmicutes bacterium HGW-Firmicutes-3]|jgi:PAS domain S-box-containing protein/putative nucleotidyltransferase with HDIG domain|nr:MAG: hypothetical protein CVU98_01550 [Firmicutes bacterium HGW-Firmicutes-3]
MITEDSHNLKLISDRKLLEEKHKKFFDLSHDMMGTANTEGYFVELNLAFEQILGWRIEELLSKPYLNFVHAEDCESTIQVAAQLAEGVKVVSFLNRYNCKDGTYRWLSWNLSPDTEDSLIYFVARDVTKQIIVKENLEKKFLENEYFLRSTIDNIQGVVYHCNNDEKWTMKYLSLGCYELTGYRPDELIDNSMVSFESLVVEKYKLNLLSLSNSFFEHEYEIQTKNKEIKWVLDRGKTIYSDEGQAIRQEGILTDITAIKIIESELKESKDQLRLVADNISEVVWLRSTDNSSIVFVNSAFEEVWGISCAELYKNPLIFMETIYEADFEQVFMAYKQYEESGCFDMSYRIVRSDGQIRWIHAKTKEAKNSRNEIVGHVGSARDITDLKNNEEKLEKFVYTLYQKDQYLNSIMETQEEMICRFLPDTTLTFVNKAYCKFLKHTEDQLIGRKFLELIPKTEHREIMSHLGSLNLNNPSVSYIQQIFDDENNEIWQEWVDTAIFNHDNKILEYQGVGRDITSKKLIEQEIANSLDLLQKTQSIAKIGSYEVDLIGDTCKSSPFLNELLGIDSLEMHPLKLWPMLIHIDDKERALRAHYESVINGSDFNQDYRIIREKDGVELWVHDIGSIEFDKEGTPLKLSGTIMDITNQMQLINELKLLNQKITTAYDTTIEGWAYALEMKEEETKEHSVRVTDLTLNIAKKLNIDEKNLVHIKRGAILHDIGKMAIPDSILLKPGKLDENEWVIMKKHPEYAFEMLSNIEFLEPALDIPYCHHEKWDGTGYPRALKGEEIPIAARVFAVVDVFDALISERPYKKAWDKDEALNHIFESSGSHFDPKVIEAFKDVLK